MPYKYTIENAMLRKEDNIDKSVVIDIKCENTTTGSATNAMPEIDKTQFAKWPPTQADIEAKAKAYLNTKNGAVTFADGMKDRIKTISDAPMAIAKVELDLGIVVKL